MSNTTFHPLTPGGSSTGYATNTHATASANSTTSIEVNGDNTHFTKRNVHQIMRLVTVDVSKTKSGNTTAAAMSLATLPRKLLAATIAAHKEAYVTSIANGNAELNLPHYRKTYPDPNPNNLPPSNADLENLRQGINHTANGNAPNAAHFDHANTKLFTAILARCTEAVKDELFDMVEIIQNQNGVAALAAILKWSTRLGITQREDDANALHTLAVPPNMPMTKSLGKTKFLNFRDLLKIK